jgi:hypothetical protein
MPPIKFHSFGNADQDHQAADRIPDRGPDCSHFGAVRRSRERGILLGLAVPGVATLRAVDVRGQWLGKGAAKRWADGLTWDMIDRDLTTLRKTPSKTEEYSPEALVFDLTMLSDIRNRLSAIPQDQRIGPVIKQSNGVPFRRDRWAKLFRIYANLAGLPRDLWMMDSRAGAMNHAKRSGASQEDRQRQANHQKPETTERYTRGHDEVRNRVIALRSVADTAKRTKLQP